MKQQQQLHAQHGANKALGNDKEAAELDKLHEEWDIKADALFGQMVRCFSFHLKHA